MSAAFEGNWTESLAAFKQSAEIFDSPEIQYLIGAVYFQLGKYKTSLKHLQSAISQDIKFADCWFMQSVIYNLLENKESADNSQIAAFESKEAGAQCLEYLQGKKTPNIEIALPFQHFKNQKGEKKYLLTGGSLRLNKFFREQIYKSIE
jgi:tetratricopeptide (TPR) repeat protein